MSACSLFRFLQISLHAETSVYRVDFVFLRHFFLSVSESYLIIFLLNIITIYFSCFRFVDSLYRVSQ